MGELVRQFFLCLSLKDGCFKCAISRAQEIQELNTTVLLHYRLHSTSQNVYFCLS